MTNKNCRRVNRKKRKRRKGIDVIEDRKKIKMEEENRSGKERCLKAEY
jgi:hypothetical protein